MKKLFSYLMKCVFCLMLFLGLSFYSVKGSTNVQAEGQEQVVEPNYLTFKANTENSTVRFSWYSGGDVYYSTDGENWNSYSKYTTITLSQVDDYVMFKGTNIVTNYNYHFYIYGDVKASGSVTSLTDASGGNEEVVLPNYCYAYMFYDCQGLTSAPELPAINLSVGCYSYMFNNCINLKKTPELPATELQNGCYCAMFAYCTSLVETCDLPAEIVPKEAYNSMYSSCYALVNGPTISATTVADYACRYMFSSCSLLKNIEDFSFVTIGNYGCQYMFSNCYELEVAPEIDGLVSVGKCGCDQMFTYCSKLIKAPALTATTIGEKAYYQMFNNCTSLTDASNMSATTLGIYCCDMMYYNCQKLVTTYKLPATTLSNYCYESMFAYCSSLVTAPELPATTLAYGCYSSMFCDCYSLKNVNVLPAKNVPEYAYSSMFSSTSLETAPEIKATQVNKYGCQYMFAYCYSLTNVPDLQFETIADYGCRYMFTYCNKLGNAPKFIKTETVGKESCREMFSHCEKLEVVSGLTAKTIGVQSYQEMFSYCSALENAPDILATTLGNSCCLSMFYGCTKLKVAPELPATTLAESCYSSMFSSCTSLKTVIDLPATTLVYGCYSSMFSDCTSLETAPVIKATAVANYSCSSMFSCCYALVNVPDFNFSTIDNYGCTHMFSYCTSLVNAPKLGNVTSIGREGCNRMYYYCTSLKNVPTLTAETIGIQSYQEMFSNCTALEIAPSINVTNLGNSCCNSMFYNCNKLKEVPVLSATTLADSCYSSMFAYCTSLEYVEDLPATSLVSSCYSGMFSGCSSLVKAPAIKATTSVYYCCSSMFADCTSLKYSPDLLFTTIENYSCQYMFSYCTSLVTAPNMPNVTEVKQRGCYRMYNYCTKLENVPDLEAQTLGKESYLEMFYYCSSLINAPAINATTLGTSCCASMYSCCYNLTNAPALTATTLASSCYSSMFAGCTSLEFAPDLPATSLVDSCYSGMFYECTSLVKAPKIYATSTASYSCNGMFQSCSSLVEVPDLEFTVIESYACQYMFNSCTSLIDAPAFSSVTEVKNYGCKGMFSYCYKLRNIPTLTALTLNKGSYQEMFTYCTALVTGPQINATTLGVQCCSSMFSYCNALTTSANLPVTTLAEYCYSSMYSYCSSLKYVSELPATTLPASCYSCMFYECSSLVTAPVIKGTVVKGSSCASMFSYCYKLKVVPELSFTSIDSYGCECMFNYCTSLVSAPEFSSVETVGSYGCKGMFANCTNLRNVPDLTATTVNKQSYREMFSYCTSLVTPPQINATTLASGCYLNMFYYCTSLKETPSLPVLTLAESCYYSMFNGCSSLKKACDLPATTLAVSCYSCMFYGCSSLEETPEIKAETLATTCFGSMFSDCTSLTKICDFNFTVVEQYSCEHMFSGCSKLVRAAKMDKVSEVKNYGCRNMYSNCTQLRFVPELTATTIGNYAYEYMFYYCLKLKVAPEIKATSMGNYCCRYMFYCCTSLDIVTTQDDDHPVAWTIPDATVYSTYSWKEGILYDCSNSQVNNLELNTTYYVPEHEYNFSYYKNNSGLIIGSFPVFDGYYNQKHNDKLNISSSEFTIPGYNFLGWSLDKDATSATYSSGVEFTIDKNNADDCNEIILYAIWEVDTTEYTVAFDDDGSIDGKTPPTYSGSHLGGTTINLSLYDGGTLERDEYIFIGWNTTKGSTDVMYSYLINKDNVTFYPVWLAKSEVVISEAPQTYTYNKNNHEFIISGGVTSDFTVLYRVGENEWSDTIPENAGSYDVSLSRFEDDEYKKYEKIIEDGLIINKAKYNTKILVWNYDDNFPFEHDGNEHSISLVSLPNGLTATYLTNNERESETDIGIYTMTATFAVEDSDNYEVPTSISRSFKIKAIELNISNSTIDKVYDGNSISKDDILGLFTISGVLNDTETASYFFENYEGELYVEVSNSYEGESTTINNKKYVAYSTYGDITNAGTYSLYIKFGLGDNYENSRTGFASYINNNLLIKITKKVLTSSDITTPTINLTYDGNSHIDDLAATYKNVNNESVALKLSSCVIYGNVASGISFTNAGNYTARYVFNSDTESLNYAFNNVNGTYYSVNYSIGKIKVDEPTTTSSFVYDGTLKTCVVTGVEDYMTEGYASISSAKNAGTYTVIYELDCNHEWNEGSDGELTWSISKIDVDMSIVCWGPTNSFVCDGGTKTVTLQNLPAFVVPTYTNNSYSALGQYTASVTLVSMDSNYNDPTFTNFEFSIVNKKANAITAEKSYTFNYGDTISFTATATHGDITITPALNTLVNAGKYTVVLSVPEDEEYIGALKNVTVIIKKIKVDEPTISSLYVFNKEEQTVTLNGVQSYMSTLSSLTQTNAGEYDLVYTLDENHEWNEGSDGIVKWTIAKADVSMDNVEWDYNSSKVYDGQPKTVILKNLPEFLVPSYTNNSFTDVGEYTASVTFTCTDSNYNAPSFNSLNWSIIDKELNSITANESYTFNYGDTITINATSTYGSISYSPALDTLVDADTYTVQLSVSETDTYIGANKTITIVINKVSNSISNFTAANKNCKESLSISAQAIVGTVTFTYSTSENGTYTSTAPDTEGTYYVKATSIGNNNYNEDSKVISFTISHLHEFDDFTWNGFTAKANYICACGDAKEFEATISSSVTKDSTCTEKGIKTYVATYDSHTDSKQEELELLSHNHVYKDFTWTGFTAKANYQCSCGDKKEYDATISSSVTKVATCTEKGIRTYTATYLDKTSTKTEELNMVEHNLVSVEGLAATCTTKGYKAYQHCSNCDYSTYEEIEALSHNYQITYTWNADNSKCNATGICLNDSAHVIEESADTYVRVTDSLVIYKAIFDNQLFTIQTKTIERGPEEAINNIYLNSRKDSSDTAILIGNIELVDGEIGSTTIMVLSDSELNLEAVNNNLKQQSINGEAISLFEIHLENIEGETITSNGNLYKVTIELSEELQNKNNYRVCYISDEGVITLIACEVVGDKLSFETTHFSEWGIIVDSESISLVTIIIIVAGCMILALLVLFLLWSMELKKFFKEDKDLSEREFKGLDSIFKPFKKIFIKAN